MWLRAKQAEWSGFPGYRGEKPLHSARSGRSTSSLPSRSWPELAGRRPIGERWRIRVGDLRVGRVGAHGSAIPRRDLVRDVERPVIGPASPEGDHGARAVTGTDEHVLGPAGAVQEVPGLQLALLALDDREAAAREHEEALLGVLAVVHAGRFARLQHAEVEADLGEARIALEAQVGAAEARAVLPPGAALAAVRVLRERGDVGASEAVVVFDCGIGQKYPPPPGVA